MPPKPPLSTAARGAGLALLAASLFGLVNVTAKATTLHPLALAGSTYLLAGLVLAPWLRGLRVARADWWRVAVMAGSGAFVAPIALYVGLRHATAADASLLLTLEMAFTALMAGLVLGERIRGGAVFGMGLLFLSALCVAGAGVFGGGLGAGTTALGVGLVVLSTVGWSVDNLASTHLTRRYEGRSLIALKSLLGGGACLVAFFAPQGLETPTVRNGLEVAFIGLLGVCASTVVFYKALKLVGATRTTAVFVPAVALSGAAAGRILLGEPLGWPHLLAALLMVAGVAILARSAGES